MVPEAVNPIGRCFPEDGEESTGREAATGSNGSPRLPPPRARQGVVGRREEEREGGKVQGSSLLLLFSLGLGSGLGASPDQSPALGRVSRVFAAPRLFSFDFFSPGPHPLFDGSADLLTFILYVVFFFYKCGAAKSQDVVLPSSVQ